VGIDIAQYPFDLHLLPEDKAAHYRNNAPGIADCCRMPTLANAGPGSLAGISSSSALWPNAIAESTLAIRWSPTACDDPSR